MSSIKEKLSEQEVYEEIYKNTKMGADSIINLLPKVKDENLRRAMTQQLDGYEKYATRAKSALSKEGSSAKEENMMVRLSARFGMAFNTMLDSTSSHIAEMMIEGSNMGITEMTKIINNCGTDPESPEALQLAREVVEFEKENLENMKPYL